MGVFNRGDSRTIYNVIYREGKTSIYYAKRFAVTSVTRDKEYDITTGMEGSQIIWFTANHNGEAETVRVLLRPKPKLKKTSFEYDFSTLGIKSKTARGNLVSKNVIRNVSLKSKGISTIAGKQIWYDTDIQKLNDEGHGLYLGEFSENDKVLAVFKNGTFYTTSFDLVNRYQGDVLRIEKFDPDKTFTALYWDAGVKSFYVKRFSFVVSDNTPLSFIAEGSKSYLVALTDDKHPRYEVVWKLSDKAPELIDAEQWIGKKGYGAKGKKVVERGEVKSVRFGEPLHLPEDDEAEVTDVEAAEVEAPEVETAEVETPGVETADAAEAEEPEVETAEAGEAEAPEAETVDIAESPKTAAVEPEPVEEETIIMQQLPSMPEPAAPKKKASSTKRAGAKASKKQSPAIKPGAEIRIPETEDEPIELLFEEPTLF